MLKHLLVICLLTSACAAVDEQRALAKRQRLDGWIGQSVDNLIRAHGIPGRSYLLSDGGVAIAYDDGREDTVSVPAPLPPMDSLFAPAPAPAATGGPFGGSDLFPPGSFDDQFQVGIANAQRAQLREAVIDQLWANGHRRVWRECWTTFSTDAHRVIVSWSRRGEGC